MSDFEYDTLRQQQIEFTNLALDEKDAKENGGRLW